MSNQIEKYQRYKINYLSVNQTGGTVFEQIKIMSWNILADAPLWKKKYASMKKDHFIYWDHRKKLILDIIGQQQPDICLLCEVEYEQILFFSQFCVEHNYGYIYTSCEPPKSKKSSENYLNYTNAKNPGILIIFKLDKLRLVNNLAPNYFNHAINQQKEHGWTEEELQLHLQPCVSNIVLFEKLDESNGRFYFTGLHHPFIKDHELVQDEQIEFLLDTIDKLNAHYKLPVIIAGDFNAKPTYKVYETMGTRGYSSAYKILTGVENLYTTTNSFTGQRMTLDYIFVNDQCKVKSVNPIDANYLERVNIPNESYPSDHIHLCANIHTL